MPPRDVLPEGDEAPPPGTRVMAIVRWGLVALMAAVAAASWIHAVGPGARAAAVQARVHCPMHPSIVQDGPGSCPVCGMDLVPLAHAPAPRARGPAAAGEYWCPMHPDVASDDPEARCERCGGMKLVARGGPHAAPPGLAPVQLSDERTQLIGMRTARAVRQRLGATVRAPGAVSPRESGLAAVTARFTGWIERVHVAQTGQRVERGEVLATVHSPEVIAAQQAFVNAARWGLEGGAGPGAQVGVGADARRKLELFGMAPGDIDALARRGAPDPHVPLRAPASGHLVRRPAAAPGAYVQPGTALFDVLDLSVVWVAAQVAPSELDRVRPGQRARFAVAGRAGEEVAGRVRFVYPAVDPESRAGQALVEVANAGLRLRPGMIGDVAIEVEARDALTVPTAAIVDTGERQYVFVSLPGGRYEPRIVQVGDAEDGRTLVRGGIAEGDVVVTTAAFLVDSESRLRAALPSFQARAE